MLRKNTYFEERLRTNATIFSLYRTGGGKMGGWAWNTEKYCLPPCLTDKKNFRILDAIECLNNNILTLVTAF